MKKGLLVAVLVVLVLVIIGVGSYNFNNPTFENKQTTNSYEDEKPTKEETAQEEEVTIPEDAELISKPDGFDWDAPIDIYKSGNEYITDFDVSDYSNEEGQTYYVSPNGDDNNIGSEDNPLQKLRTALEKDDVSTVILKEGLYSRKLSSVNFEEYNKSVTIKAEKNAILSGHEKVSDFEWSQEGNVYSTEIDQFLSIMDASIVNDDNDYSGLEEVESVDEVNNQDGSYYHEDNILYLHMFDSREVNDDIRIYVNVPLIRLEYVADADLYIEGVQFEGGRGIEVRNTEKGTPNLYMKDVKVKYGMNTDGGIALKGVKDAFFENVEVAHNENDGFNYHDNNGVISNVIEVNVIGRDNGVESNTDNGSTMHDGGKIIRLNSYYYKNVGPNIADVNAGTHSWNVGVESYESLATDGLQNADYVFNNGDPDNKVLAWLEGCKGHSSTTSIDARDNTEVYHKDCEFESSNATELGEIDNY